ncbi:MAG: dihydropteroate synthase [Roseburia sp.]|nr:dihydropteroate synthase [Roseburia sp.]MCM1277901.1 dihydropteroate synthase [Robinsoniella sp.]
MKIGNRDFDFKNQTYVMGILNVTPDSFSDGGKFFEMDQALFHAEEMIKEGAAVIDVGGESTRPGYIVVPDEEEIERVVPIIEAIKSRLDIPVSLDTYKSKVSEAGISAGADMINDIWGLKYDEKLAGVIAKSGLPCCLMHNRKEADYNNFMEEVLMDLSETAAMAEKAGIKDTNIILDPGIGFGKTYENNLEIIRCLEELHAFGYPILLGASRKSVIGLALDLPIEERLEGTLVTTVFGVLKGCSIIRVHDVKENIRAIRMARAILGKGIE